MAQMMSSDGITTNHNRGRSTPTDTHLYLVGGIPTPLKNDVVRQLG